MAVCARITPGIFPRERSEPPVRPPHNACNLAVTDRKAGFRARIPKTPVFREVKCMSNGTCFSKVGMINIVCLNQLEMPMPRCNISLSIGFPDRSPHEGFRENMTGFCDATVSEHHPPHLIRKRRSYPVSIRIRLELPKT